MPIERRQSANAPKRVLLIGWDAADWQLIHPLVDQGLMPTMASLIKEGAWGNLATIRPILSPMLWNSIATGKRAQDHGVYGFTEPNADGTGVRPVASTSRKCKAVWNILTQNGLRSNVVGWYASHPAEPINGVMVSNQFEQFTARRRKNVGRAGGCHPSVRSNGRARRVSRTSGEIDASAILPFVPDAAALIGKEGNRLGKLQHMLAQTATIHATATHLMSETEWDFTAVYYEGIDRFGHEFMAFHPPKMEQVSQEEFDAYQHCMVGHLPLSRHAAGNFASAGWRRYRSDPDVGSRLLQRSLAARPARRQVWPRRVASSVRHPRRSRARLSQRLAAVRCEHSRYRADGFASAWTAGSLRHAGPRPGRSSRRHSLDRAHRVVGRNRRRQRDASRRNASRPCRVARNDAATRRLRIHIRTERRRRKVNSRYAFIQPALSRSVAGRRSRLPCRHCDDRRP